MKNIVNRTLIVMAMICLAVSVKAQDSPDTINRIDYLNLDGTFIKFSYYYVDSLGAAYGLFNIQQCQVFTTAVIGKQAIVSDTGIAAYRYDRKYIELYYPDKIVYCKFKDKDFTKFLRENTIEGKLVSRDKVLIDGKKPKIYCNIKMRSYKLTDRCE